jgi:hypothetical protein
MNSRPALTHRLTLLVAATAASLTLALGATVAVGLGHLAPAANAPAPTNELAVATGQADGSQVPLIAGQPAPSQDRRLLGPTGSRERDGRREEIDRDRNARARDGASRPSGAFDSLRHLLSQKADYDD